MSFPREDFRKDYVPFVDPTDAPKLGPPPFEESAVRWDSEKVVGLM